nr:hypothetical protein [Tanacetum cinerariifolium]
MKQTKKKDQDQIKKDAEVALKIQAHLNEEAMIERESQEEEESIQTGEENLKSQQMFQDIDDVIDEDADTEMIVKDKGNGEKRGSITEIVRTARPEVSTTKPKTPPIITNLFDNEDVTIADTLVKMKNQKAKEKGISFKMLMTLQDQSDP